MKETTRRFIEITRRKQQTEIWRNRTDSQAAQAEAELISTELMIRELHRVALANIEKEIAAFYGRYAECEGISMAIAKRRVEKIDVAAFSKKVKDLLKSPTLDKEAMRLARTETVRVQTQAQFDSIKANGWEWFEVKAYGSKSCEECKRLDGKRFKVDEFTPAKNAPPFHPKCRCRILPWEDEESESLLNALREEKELDDIGVRGIINTPEMFAKKQDGREGFRFISDRRFDELTIEARKEGALIIRGGDEVEKHLDEMGASASTIDDVILFRENVCVSEVLEEIRHFKQNKIKLNNDKGEPLRSILNEIEAKEYVLRNAKKYRVPRKEVEQLEKQVESYRKQLLEVLAKEK